MTDPLGLNELHLRRLIALAAVRTMAAEKDDPRARHAEMRYRAELAEIERQIEELTLDCETEVADVKAGKQHG